MFWDIDTVFLLINWQGNRENPSSDGLRLPKGTNVAFLIDALHRVEEYWDEPNEFLPERFSPENSKNRDPYSYIPFSVG